MNFSHFLRTDLSRRRWIASSAAGIFVAPNAMRLSTPVHGGPGLSAGRRAALAAQVAEHAHAMNIEPVEALALRAVDAAKDAGAQYAAARLTRTTWHYYGFMFGGQLLNVIEQIGVGVQAVVNGYWGFASSPNWNSDEVERLGRAAVAQAAASAKATGMRNRRETDLGRYPVATGSWRTPVKIDPFSVPVEEKIDSIGYWVRCAAQTGLEFSNNGMYFLRQERVVANTEGARFAQTTFETGASANVSDLGGDAVTVSLGGFDNAAVGWELFVEGRIPERLPGMRERIAEERALQANVQPADIGRYTVVCSGDAMAALLDATLGTATQLDRALGYEANASGTSYLTDPLGMLGQHAVASRLVTVTANRSMPRGLATVKWDDEGVEPDTATLVKEGVLADFQTTRESSAWLKDYYAKVNKPVRSHGHAASESALYPSIQHAPNLSLEPNANGSSVDELIGGVTDGIFFETGAATADFQGITGLLQGAMRRIKNGRLGPRLNGGANLFSANDLWKNVIGVGGQVSCDAKAMSPYKLGLGMLGTRLVPGKGEPAQVTSRTVTAPAVVIKDQAIINPWRRA